MKKSLFGKAYWRELRMQWLMKQVGTVDGDWFEQVNDFTLLGTKTQRKRWAKARKS